MRRPMACLLLSAALAVQAAPPAAVDREIDGLIAALEHSRCEFGRNGRWYAAPQAREHLRRRYAWLRERDAVRSTEEFIDRAATRSSVTGREYAVRCGSAPVLPSRTWFGRELARLRAGR